jgi:esterase/lipase superfamily enzyme
MDRYQVELDAPGFDRAGVVIRYGHWGRPVLVFPSERGRAWDYENNGMVGAVADLVDAGRVKLYCVDAFDEHTWSDTRIPLEERAHRHRAYVGWLLDRVMPFVASDSPGAVDAIVTGCSMGAYHALQLALTRADLFPVALCLSGSYDPSRWDAWGERGEAAYFTNPTDHVAHLHGEHLSWLRSRLHVVLVVGEGSWETHPTGALPSTLQMAGLLAAKGISHELDVWGCDSAHDWDWWQRQLAHHLPRFC